MVDGVLEDFTVRLRVAGWAVTWARFVVLCWLPGIGREVALGLRGTICHLCIRGWQVSILTWVMACNMHSEGGGYRDEHVVILTGLALAAVHLAGWGVPETLRCREAAHHVHLGLAHKGFFDPWGSPMQ